MTLMVHRSDNLGANDGGLERLGSVILSPVEGFVKIGDFEGAADDPQHQGWSPLLGLHAAVTRATGSFISSSQQVGSTRFSDVTVAKCFDGASPKSQQACASGQKLQKVQIHVCSEVGGKPRVTTEIELSDVLVTRHEVTGVTGLGDGRQMELVSFAFGKISWTFNKMDGKGTAQGKVAESFTVGN
jgi:type VI secretion system Hcp family effector